MTLPWQSGALLGSIVAPLWSAAIACLVGTALAHGSVLAALLPILFGTAYAPYLGDHLASGVSRMRALASPASVLAAAGLSLLFLATVVLVALAIERAAIRRRPDLIGDRQTLIDRVTMAVVVALFAASLYAALRSGFWTFYGTAQSDAPGGVRLELHYHQLLFALIALLVAAKRTTRTWIALAGLSLLLFLLQQRRLMVACAALFVLKPWLSAQMTRRRRMVVLAAALLVGFSASSAWRADRIELGKADQQQLERRFTYLWIDALSFEHAERTDLDLSAAAAGELARVTPGLLYPDKYTVRDHSCETAFRRLGFTADLPCTPVTEGYLGLGILGVLLLALLWAPFVALASFGYRSRSVGARFCGLLIFAPLIDIETRAFPVIRSLRLALMLGLSVLVVAALVRWLVARPQPPTPPTRSCPLN